jgi:hypothetical protein
MGEKATVRIGIVLYAIAGIVTLRWLILLLHEGLLEGLYKVLVPRWGGALGMLLTVAVAVWALTRAGLPSPQQDAGKGEEIDSQLALAFKRRRRLQLLSLSPLTVLLAVLIASMAVVGEGAPLLLGLFAPPLLALVAAAFVFTLMNWRCPACGKLLKGLNPSRCAKCGVRFRG